MNHGFDRFYGLNCQRQSHNFYPTHVWSDRKKGMQSPEERISSWRKTFPEFEKMPGKYGWSVITNPVAAFAGMMEHLDEDVGRILDVLEELKIDDNTLVIFTSDNGPHKEGGHKPDFFDSNGPPKGY